MLATNNVLLTAEGISRLVGARLAQGSRALPAKQDLPEGIQRKSITRLCTLLRF